MYNLKLDSFLKINTKLVLGLLVVFLAVSPTVFGGVANDVCADCHDEVSEMFHDTPHGIFLSTEQYSCESCHGSAIDHVADGDPEKIINPARHDQFGGKELCLTCHDNHRYDEWSFSSHNTAGVTCADCHSVHQTEGTVTQKTGDELCYGCHSNIRAETFMPSHHPIAEGKLECQDCHGIHGENTTLTMNSTTTELCYSCHAEKEGPFIYEHAPVNEDCMICHNPHGSVATKLLKQSEPTICLSCHPMHFHTTAISVDGDFETPQAPERAGTSTYDSMEAGMLTKCTQCHTEIHGSDHPSQTIPTGGAGLTR